MLTRLTKWTRLCAPSGAGRLEPAAGEPAEVAVEPNEGWGGAEGARRGVRSLMVGSAAIKVAGWES